MKKHLLLFALALGVSAGLLAQPGGGGSGASTTYDYGTAINGLWSYNSSSDVYYIVGLFYCASPADEDYEQMGIYVPGAYMNATSNGDGTYTCTLNTSGTVNGYTASTAPVVFLSTLRAIRHNRHLRATRRQWRITRRKAWSICGRAAVAATMAHPSA